MVLIFTLTPTTLTKIEDDLLLKNTRRYLNKTFGIRPIGQMYLPKEENYMSHKIF